MTNFTLLCFIIMKITEMSKCKTDNITKSKAKIVDFVFFGYIRFIN